MSHDTWFHRVARAAVRPLVGSAVTPNHLTTLRLLLGLAAAGAFAIGSDSARDWGAGLFLLAMLLDRMDGELARLAQASSLFGHRYDLVTDALCESLAFIALGYGLSGGPFGRWALAMGLLAAVAIGLTFILLNWSGSPETRAAREVRLSPRFDPDDALIAVPFAIWLGQAEGLLAAAALGAPLFAFFVLLRPRLKGSVR